MKRILVIRTSAIGDIVMASPMIRVMREAWPDSYIAWLVEPTARGLLEHHPLLDDTVIWPKMEWRQLLKTCQLVKLGKAVLEFRQKLHRIEFTHVLDAQGLMRTRFMAYLSGAKERIGLDSREPGRFLMTRIESRGDQIEQMSSEYRHLMRQLGLVPGKFRPEIHLSGNSRSACRKILRELGVPDAYAVICPFTTRPQKEWLGDRWAEITDRIRDGLPLPVVMLGGHTDIEDSLNLQRLTKGSLFNLTGQTSLIESAAVIEKAALVIGVDTGLTHMGTAFERPTVALFGSTCPYLDTPSDKTVVIYNPLPCSPCRHKPTCDGQFTCMDSIHVEQVFEAIKQVAG